MYERAYAEDIPRDVPSSSFQPAVGLKDSSYICQWSKIVFLYPEEIQLRNTGDLTIKPVLRVGRVRFKHNL